MEIVIAATTAPCAEHMQKTLIGHTMSGEALERRPQVQFTGAADFLDAALRVYEITSIRLAPQASSLELVDVIAEYRPMVWHCEACDNICGRPGQLEVVRFSEYHCWCSPICRKRIEAAQASAVHSARAELGDPVEAVVNFVFTHNTMTVIRNRCKCRQADTACSVPASTRAVSLASLPTSQSCSVHRRTFRQ